MYVGCIVFLLPADRLALAHSRGNPQVLVWLERQRSHLPLQVVQLRLTSVCGPLLGTKLQRGQSSACAYVRCW